MGVERDAGVARPLPPVRECQRRLRARAQPVKVETAPCGRAKEVVDASVKSPPLALTVQVAMDERESAALTPPSTPVGTGVGGPPKNPQH